MIYDDLDQEIIAFIQGDLPLQKEPYNALARRLGVEQQEIVQRLQRLHRQGIIKRAGAVLRHQKAGYTVNAMVVWKVLEDKVDSVGQAMARHRAVSHCYLRDVPDFFPYSLFSMLHARSEEELEQIIQDLAVIDGIEEYQVIRSLKEYKKESMRYF